MFNSSSGPEDLKLRKNFKTMDSVSHHIASVKGGQNSHKVEKAKRAHEFNSEQAREAAKKRWAFHNAGLAKRNK